MKDFCIRCEANLDALRIAGSRAIFLCQTALESDSDVGSVLALLLAVTNNQPEAAEQAVALLSHATPDIREAAWRGLRLANPTHSAQPLKDLAARSNCNFDSVAALDILAFHRLPVRHDFTELSDAPEEIAWLLAEAGGRLPKALNTSDLKQFIGHPSSRVREAALRASARCGVSNLIELCRESAAQTSSNLSEAVDFLGVVGTQDDLALLQNAVSNPSIAKAAVSALGRIGFSAAVPFLMELLSSPELAGDSAAAVERITGHKLPVGAAPDPPPDLTEEELDLWEPTPPVDVSRANSWWKATAGRFDPNMRWQAGFCVSDEPLGSVFDQLPLGIRYDLYLRQRALAPGTPDWELETWTWKQKNPGG